MFWEGKCVFFAHISPKYRRMDNGRQDGGYTLIISAIGGYVSRANGERIVLITNSVRRRQTAVDWIAKEDDGQWTNRPWTATAHPGFLPAGGYRQRKGNTHSKIRGRYGLILPTDAFSGSDVPKL